MESKRQYRRSGWESKVKDLTLILFPFIAGIIAQEILQGVGNDAQHRSILRYLLLFSKIDAEFVDYLAAANIYRSLRRRGLTIRSPVDCLIAALAIKQKASLLHKDTDFTLIAQHFPLSVI